MTIDKINNTEKESDYEKIHIQTGLQDDASKECQQFLSIYLPCVILAKTFNNKASTYLLSTFLNVTLESFAIVIYLNSYEFWMANYWTEGKDSWEGSNICDISADTSPTVDSSIAIGS